MKTKRFMGGLAVAILCLSLVACTKAKDSSGGASEVTEVAGPKTITLTESWDFDSGFYPVITAEVASNYGMIYWAHNFYDTLVKYTPNGEIVGSLAESWNISEDGLTYTFKIRQGVKFSDGTLLTADMVKQSIEASITNLGMYNGSYGRLSALITSMEAPDSNTFVMTLVAPYYATLNDLSMSCPLAIVNPKAFEGGHKMAYENLANGTNGTGAYMFAGDFDGTTYTFVRNPYYWGEAPVADSFKIKVIPENDSKVLALRNGEIDGIIGSSRLSYDSFTALRDDDSYGTSVAETATLTRYLGFNMNLAPFDSKAVRESVAYAIDQQAFETGIFNGLETAAETLFTPDRPYCDVAAPTYETDIAKANTLLEEAGWVDSNGDGVRERDGANLEVVFSYTNDLASVENAILAIKASLESIGFSVKLQPADMMGWYGDVMSGRYNITLWKSTGGSYDPSTVITNINPNNSADPIAVQFAKYIDQSLLDEVDSTSNLARVKEIYEVVLKTIAQECLIVPLSYTHETFAYNQEKIAGYTYGYDSQYVDISSIELR